MKYLDARTSESLWESVKSFLQFTDEEMQNLLESIDCDESKYPCDWIEDFLSDYIVDETFEEIQMFHLTRRLNGSDLKENYNLKQLLLTETPLSDFFKRHKVTFKETDEHIDMYLNGKLQPLDSEFRYQHGNIYYLKSRLGYNHIQDFCVNGFAFRSLLEKDNYFSLLSRCPELVENIERLLEIEGMSEDYKNNSKYYCIEYLIPMSEAIFDVNNPPESEHDKTVYLMSSAIERLYWNWKNPKYQSNSNNIILRLPDDESMRPEWFVKAEEIADK